VTTSNASSLASQVHLHIPYGLLWTPCHQVSTLADRVKGPFEGTLVCVPLACNASLLWQSIDQLSEDSPFANREYFFSLGRTGLDPARARADLVHGVVWCSHRWLRSTRRLAETVTWPPSSRLVSCRRSSASLSSSRRRCRKREEATARGSAHYLPLAGSHPCGRVIRLGLTD